MISFLFAGFLAGLSVGVYCLGTCLPIFIPILLQAKQNFKSSFRIVLEFSGGRLLGYTFFGGIIGFLGQRISSQSLHQIFNLPILLMGLLLIFTSVGMMSWGKKGCKIFFAKIKVPIVLGFLTGVNICPPFIASLSYVFNLVSAFKSVLYFLAFFIGTSLYIIPFGLLGFFGKFSFLQKIARISGIFIGFYFYYMGLKNLIFPGLS